MAETPNENELREAFCEIGRRVWLRQYVAANDGNFSARLADGNILCTPANVSKGFMRPEQMGIVTPEGAKVSGPLPTTSEILMHLEIYRLRPDIKAVVHAHPPHATAFAVAGDPLPRCVLAEIEILVGEIPIVPYATTGTPDLSAALRPYVPGHDAYLLANHGAVTTGRDVFEAYYRMESVEQYCRVLAIGKEIGPWTQIETGKVRELLKVREKLGLPEKRHQLSDQELCPPTTPNRGNVIDDIVRRVMERLRKTD
ncbi:MAG: class II aldolase/adducin family protein [Candidatus Sumerlaeaceae bacterium]|nr:class II aldolase/adducin family protein [Candidatus Sumerlaeaceae bacterium]